VLMASVPVGFAGRSPRSHESSLPSHDIVPLQAVGPAAVHGYGSGTETDRRSPYQDDRPFGESCGDFPQAPERLVKFGSQGPLGRAPLNSLSKRKM
jgi:hypothetical protein